MNNLAVFASGSGSNAENIITFFRSRSDVSVKLIATDNADAYVLKRAERLGVPAYCFTMEELRNGAVLSRLQAEGITFVVLAGFLRLIPEPLVRAFSGRIVNIHPALLPRYGGKGMYGMNVHRAVIANGERESGITIHLVNSRYDEGDIVFQAKCPVFPDDTPELLAQRVHELEYKHYPRVISQLLE